MSEEKNDQVEITFRLGTQQLGQLAQLLEALAGATKLPESTRQTVEETVESGQFDPERFRELTGAEAGEASISDEAAESGPSDTQPERTETAAAEPELPDQEMIPLPGEAELPRVPAVEAGIEVELPQAAQVVYNPVLPEASPARGGGEETVGVSATVASGPTVQNLSRQCQRDARRYDGGFPIY